MGNHSFKKVHLAMVSFKNLFFGIKVLYIFDVNSNANVTSDFTMSTLDAIKGHLRVAIP